MTTHQPPRLSRQRIRDRRLELGLSEREVAAHWGVSTAVVRSVENGSVATDLTLGQVAKLGAILGLDLTELLDTQHGPDAPSAPASAADDAAVVGSLLADVRVLVPVEGLAEALGWNLDRARSALDNLDAGLRGVGMRIHRLHQDVRIARTVTTIDPKTLEGFWRIHLARRSITSAQARLLRLICDGVVDLGNTKDTHKVRLPELRNAGLIEAADARTGASAGWEPTEAVRFSLLLDELPRTRDVAAPAKPVPAHRAALRGGKLPAKQP
ncbi:multiprotein-bridging factor 1 family protein [Pedococcus sp. NPDC057267]|uniref:helix-turn-helix domain-containing protein n=1 Tax=Pedococcus sp. NPDC057267 TaxID=3346077 RepID=UPI0036353536